MRANILITGKTGVGKSTLINAIFNENLAKTGTGTSVTQKTEMFKKFGFPFKIYDTKGLELGDDTGKTEILEKITKQTKFAKRKDFIHAVWYCINSTSDRIEHDEETYINKLSEYVPVVIVLTKATLKNETQALKTEIQNQKLNAFKIIPLLASSYEFEFDDEIKVCKQFGLQELIDTTMDAVSEKSIIMAMNMALFRIAKMIHKN